MVVRSGAEAGQAARCERRRASKTGVGRSQEPVSRRAVARSLARQQDVKGGQRLRLGKVALKSRSPGEHGEDAGAADQ
eukprot:3099579-Alexandrium_andersonii.AAC.1